MLTLVAVLIAGVVTLTDAEVKVFKEASDKHRAESLKDSVDHLNRMKKNAKSNQNRSREQIAATAKSISDYTALIKNLRDKKYFVRPPLTSMEQGSIGNLTHTVRVRKILSESELIIDFNHPTIGYTVAPGTTRTNPTVIKVPTDTKIIAVIREGFSTHDLTAGEHIVPPGKLFKVTGTSEQGSRKYPLLEPVDEADLQKRLNPAKK